MNVLVIASHESTEKNATCAIDGGVMRRKNRCALRYWQHEPQLFLAALKASLSGQSLDDLMRASALRKDADRSTGSLSQRPKIKKSKVTP